MQTSRISRQNVFLRCTEHSTSCLALRLATFHSLSFPFVTASFVETRASLFATAHKAFSTAFEALTRVYKCKVAGIRLHLRSYFKYKSTSHRRCRFRHFKQLTTSTHKFKAKRSPKMLTCTLTFCFKSLRLILPRPSATPRPPIIVAL